ncbi:MAG: methyltransferase domain-containing protein [Bacteriovorax sp.]|nr:methyltransferase domain-containing protein [Bacteriovorax sp.]
MTENKELETYFKLMLAGGSIALYNYVQEHSLLTDYKVGDTFSAKSFAEKFQFKLCPAEVFLNSLIALGLLEKKGDIYGISPVMELLKGNYKNLSAEYWAHLPTLLKTGTPFKRMDAVVDSEKEYQVQVKSLEWMMTPCAELMVEMIAKTRPDLLTKKDLKVLDVGAGSGVWGFNFLYKNKNAHATLADWPAVLVVAKETASRKNIIDRVKTIEGNFHESTWPENAFNFATLGNVTHILTAEANKTLFKKIYKSMQPGGELIILDAYGEVSEGELARALYQMGLTIRTIQGRVFMPEELKPWLMEAGFKTFEFHSLDVIPHSMGMLIAKK